MSDIALVLERSIDAGADAVWHVITDLEGSEAVLSGVTRIERLAGLGWSIGTRWRETRKAMGGESTEEMEVVGIDEGRSTMVAAETHGLAYRTEFTLEPAAGADGTERTLLRMRFSGSYVSPSWLQRAMAKLFSGIGTSVTRTMMQQDLDDIAAAAEAR